MERHSISRAPSHHPDDPHCLPLARGRAPHLLPKPLRRRARSPVLLWACPLFEPAGGELAMEGFWQENGGGEGDLFSDSVEGENHGSSSSSETPLSEEPPNRADSGEPSATLGWPLRKSSASRKEETNLDDGETNKPLKTSVSEIEMMKERFSKLLLGEDMSGSGKGACTALAISNAITNLCATIFGELWRLEPLSPEKKSMWQREMEWLVCVSDHIIELTPSWQTFPDGSKHEVMTCRPRSDLHINLPALRKLDNMLLEVLQSFCDPEFWYIDQGVSAPNSDGSSSFIKHNLRQEEKWWLPVPRVPPGGLSKNTRKQLQYQRECTNQILKAVMAINSNALDEMEVPDSYLESLPKNGRASLGGVIYRYITSDQFSPECLLDCLDFASEYKALEIANRVEASIYIWRRRAAARPVNTSRTATRSSWGAMKEMIVDAEKRELLADRAERFLLCLKQRFPGLTQTTLDASKIQFNKDVGKSVLESYSRVLESLAFNIVARIEDVIYVDDLTKHSDQFSAVPAASITACKRFSIPYSMPVSRTPYETAYATPRFSPTPLVSPLRAERTSFVGRKSHSRGLGVKKVLTEHLGVEVKAKSSGNAVVLLEPQVKSRAQGLLK